MAQHTADSWIRHLQLTQHIEGGWYSEVYRSALIFEKEKLPPVFTASRHSCTHIYFLLDKTGFSAFHRIKSDELWHFYAGDPLVVYEIDPNGILNKHLLGHDIEKGQSLFSVIKAGNWFASRVESGGEYSLAGCTVSPGFDFSDFEMADRNVLSKTYPKYTDLIYSLTYS